MLYTSEDLRRFWSYTYRDNTTGCIMWSKSCSGKGYGNFIFRGKHYNAHRWIAQAYAGRKLQTKEHVLHSCDTPRCVNTAHLRIGSHSENMRDRFKRFPHTHPRSNRYKTHCPQNHEYTVANTFIDTRGYRVCRKCTGIRRASHDG